MCSVLITPKCLKFGLTNTDYITDCLVVVVIKILTAIISLFFATGKLYSITHRYL